MFENGSVSTDFESEKSLLGVLVAISIPIFTNQLEKSREATDASNIRAAYAEVMVKLVEDPTAAVTHDPVDLKQSVDGWQNAANETSLKELEHTAADASDVAVTVNISGVTKGGKVTFTYTPASGSTSGSLAIAAA